MRVLLVDLEREPEPDERRGERRAERRADAIDPINRPVIIAVVPEDRRWSGRR
jgi:hypothetical protein